MYPKCRICNEEIDTESPFVTVGGAIFRNPYTFRLAWLHYLCYDWSLEMLESLSPNDRANFSSRYDEFIDKEDSQ